MGIRLSNHYLSKGEEPGLTEGMGSALFYFAGCNMHCVFCSVYPFSQYGQGTEISGARLTELFLNAERKGASNINLCNPGQAMGAIAQSLQNAKNQGLSLPVVYNSNGYDRPAFFEQYGLWFDIYLMDFKFGREEAAYRWAGTPDYCRVAETALNYAADRLGGNVHRRETLVKGVLLRHLALPEDSAASYEVVDRLARMGLEYPLNLMGDYVPEWKAASHKAIRGFLDPAEHKRLAAYAQAKDLKLVPYNV
jgi:putative pyruvate formate lyase activating enzyme